jgi:hypothetical protein
VADTLEARIDELYQLPLDEFTKARNALAKTLSGDAKQRVASLTKPTSALWAINRLHGKDPGTYKALIDASEKLRTAHRSVLAGKKIDLRKPDEVHRAALERAVAKAIELLEQATGSASEPVRDTIRRTLAALPSEDPAGRLTREPAPAGFGLFAGVTPRATAREPEQRAKTSEDRGRRGDEREKRRAEQAAEQARKQAERARDKALADARKQLKAAQEAAERATFAVRKAEGDLASAQTAETRAANQLKNAKDRLAELEK